VLVYRVETVDCVGAFNIVADETEYFEYVMGDYNDYDRHPFMKNPDLSSFEDARFGCTSLAQLRRWFSARARTHLAQYGAAISVYDTEAVIADENQCVFDLDQAQLVERRCLIRQCRN